MYILIMCPPIDSTGEKWAPYAFVTKEAAEIWGNKRLIELPPDWFFEIQFAQVLG